MKSVRVMVIVAVVAAVTVLVGAPSGATPPTPEGCLSIDGVMIYADGISICQSAPGESGKSNIARAKNAGWATAGGSPGDSGNYAEANGANARASARNGDKNVAVATGDSAQATATDGDNNVAVASGLSAAARSGSGDKNRAVATGLFAYAEATVGHKNRAVATGESAYAVAGLGDKNRAFAIGDLAIAQAANGNKNRALDTISVLVDGVDTCAGNGDDKENAVNQNLCA